MQQGFRLRLVLGAIMALLCQAAVAQRSGLRCAFNIPAQGAETAMKAFSEQSGKGVIMNANTVEGIRTNRLKGTFTPLEALQHLLAGTGLVATLDEKSGAFVVHRKDKEGFLKGAFVGGGYSLQPKLALCAEAKWWHHAPVIPKLPGSAQAYRTSISLPTETRSSGRFRGRRPTASSF